MRLPFQAPRRPPSSGGALPPFEGVPLAADDPGPVTVASMADVVQLAMPARFLSEGPAAFAWRMRVVPSFDSPPAPGGGSQQRVLLGSNWFGVGSSAIAYADRVTLTHSGGSTSPSTPSAPTWSAGDIVDIGFDDARHIVVRVNGGPALISTSLGPSSGGWAGYSQLHLGGTPGSPYQVFAGVIYAPRTLPTDWWT